MGTVDGTRTKDRTVAIGVLGTLLGTLLGGLTAFLANAYELDQSKDEERRQELRGACIATGNAMSGNANTYYTISLDLGEGDSHVTSLDMRELLAEGRAFHQTIAALYLVAPRPVRKSQQSFSNIANEATRVLTDIAKELAESRQPERTPQAKEAEAQVNSVRKARDRFVGTCAKAVPR